MSSKIEYLDETWNFMGGCSACSPGCAHCWACRQAAGRLKNHPLYKGLTKNGKWTGKIRLCTDIGRADLLEKPLHWREPRRIGVQFMGDLFLAPFEFIDRVFDVIKQGRVHTYQLLTKRPKRMADFIFAKWPKGFEQNNVWLGVTVEHPDYKGRIDILRQIPAAVRFISIEPCLVDMGELNLEGIDWVILGGESGPGARPMHPDNPRNARDQCVAAGVLFFFKQWGAWKPCDKKIDCRNCNLECGLNRRSWSTAKEGCSIKVGKKKAGRLLDGREWNQYPKEMP